MARIFLFCTVLSAKKTVFFAKNTCKYEEKRVFFYRGEIMHKEKMEIWEKKNNFPLHVVTTNMNEVVPIHTHDFIEIVFFARGSASHSIFHGSKKLRYSVMQGDCFSILPKEKHSFEDGHAAYYYNIIFSQELILNELQDLKELDTWSKLFGNKEFSERSKFHLGWQEREEMNALIGRLINELSRKAAGYKIYARALLIEILFIILRCSPKKMLVSESSVKSNFSLIQVISDMEKYPEKNYNLTDMAKKANMCVSGFTKKFRNLLGVSSMEYLLSLRIEKAEQMLLKSMMSVYEISEQCGFYDINYFIKVFRRFRGNTPAKFRKIKELEKESAE